MQGLTQQHTPNMLRLCMWNYFLKWYPIKCVNMLILMCADVNRPRLIERLPSLFHFSKSINRPYIMRLSTSAASYCFILYYFVVLQLYVFVSLSLTSFLYLSSSLPLFHPSIHQPVATWLLPISGVDPWRGLVQGCAPLGYWTQPAAKANGLWGGGWTCHLWLLLFTN